MSKSHYLPLLYLEKVKRPGQNYFFKQIITDDYLVLVLGISWLTPQPLLNSISLLILTLSLFCIYEIGYWENDKLGEQFEENPTLSETYTSHKDDINYSWEPWLWSLGLTIPALFLLEMSQISFAQIKKLAFFNYFFISKVLIDTLWWISLLVFIRFVFRVYNRMNVKARVWLFPVLQSTKCFGFLLFSSTNLIGILFFISQVLSRWFPYFIYRYGGNRKDFPKRMARVFVFIFLLSSLITHRNSFGELLTYKFQLAVIIITILLRAVADFKQVLRDIKTP